jgi:hypothetical protein
MQTKSVHPSPVRSHDGLSAKTDLIVEHARRSSVRIAPFARLFARRAMLRERQAGLASLFDERTAAGLPNLTHTFVEQRLLETARLVAELLELAERSGESSHASAEVGRGGQGMRLLGEACFDAALRIDAARQALVGSVNAEAAHRRRHCLSALRCAQEVLTTLEQQLARTLSD